MSVINGSYPEITLLQTIAFGSDVRLVGLLQPFTSPFSPTGRPSSPSSTPSTTIVCPSTRLVASRLKRNTEHSSVCYGSSRTARAFDSTHSQPPLLRPLQPPSAPVLPPLNRFRRTSEGTRGHIRGFGDRSISKQGRKRVAGAGWSRRGDDEVELLDDVGGAVRLPQDSARR